MRVRFTPRARNDLAEILKYIDERSPRGAQNVKRAIRKAIELIGEFSEGGLRPDRIGYVDSKVCKDQRDAKDFWYAAAVTTRKLFMAKESDLSVSQSVVGAVTGLAIELR